MILVLAIAARSINIAAVRMHKESYTDFAYIYDVFMDNAPYSCWHEQTVKHLQAHGITSGIVADLGCGTGTLTEMLAESGYDMIGIDASEDMLNLAMDKKYSRQSQTLYLCQDMRRFELYGTCRAIISRCDSLNYLESTKDLVQVFRLVNNYLDPQGMFLFDCNTVYKYSMLADKTIAENRPEGSFIWENTYDEARRKNRYDLTLYLKDGDGRHYIRSEETHVQTAFTLEEIQLAAAEAGLKWGYVLDADTDREPLDTTERYLIALFEQGK